MVQQERRKFVRITDSLDTWYRMVKALGGTSSKSKNISESGICFSTIYRWVPGVIVELRIILRGHPSPVSIIGEVVWVNPGAENKLLYDVGIKFIKIDDAERSRLLEYVGHMRKNKE